MTAKFHCNYCDEDIKKVRVKCGECPDFDLCLKCFSSGAEIGKHKNKHKYQLIDCGTFPIFESPSSKWKAIEEVALLEAVELYGFGNWNDVASFIGTRTEEEVKEHFCNYYVYGNIGKHTWDVLRNTTLEIKDHTCDDRPLSPKFHTSSSSSPNETINIDSTQQQQLGYMPKRDDFEREYDNEAESVISYLTISQEDDETDKELKAIHVNVYKQRLTERFRRKAIVREYNLVNLFFKKEEDVEDNEDDFNLTYKIKNNKQKDSPQKEGPKELDLEFMNNKDLIEKKMRILSQFQSQEEQKLLIDNLHREYELRQKLKELLKIRKKNLKKLNDSKELKSPKKKEIKKTAKMNLMDDTGCVQKSTFYQTNKKSNGEESNINQTPVKIKELKRSDQLAIARKLVLDSESDDELSNSSFKKSITSNNSNSNHDLNSLNKNSKDKFDVYSMPSTRLLSDQEKKFCNTIKLRPSQYLNLKTLILKEHVQKKGKNSNNGKSVLENVDKITHKKMINFMTKLGWMK